MLDVELEREWGEVGEVRAGGWLGRGSNEDRWKVQGSASWKWRIARGCGGVVAEEGGGSCEAKN